MSGDFVVNYQGRDDGFGSATRRAAESIRRLGVEAAGIANGELSVLRSRLAGLATVGFVGAKIHEAMQFADSMIRMSQTTGLSTDSLQELSYSAGQTSVSMDAITSSIKLMERARIDALRGNKQLSASFLRLGIDSGQLKSLSADELFRAIARSINQSDYSAQQLSDTLKVMGRGAAVLFPLFNEGLDQMSAKAREAAQVMSEETLKSLDDLGDKMTEFSGTARTAFGIAAGAILPFAKAVLEQKEQMWGFFAAIGAGIARGNISGALSDAIDNAASEARGKLEAAIAANPGRRKGGGSGAELDVAIEEADKRDAIRIENAKALRELELKRLDVQARIARLTLEESEWKAKVAKSAEDTLAREEAIRGLTSVQKELQAAKDSKSSGGIRASGGGGGFSRNLDEWSRIGFFTGGAPSAILKVNQEQLKELQKQVAILQRLPEGLADAI